MNLIDFLTPNCIKVPLLSKDKEGAIHEIIDMIVQQKQLKDPDEIKAMVWRREQIRTTGIGHGVAIPHGRSDSLDNIILAVGKAPTPIQFDSIDKKPVVVIFLVLYGPHHIGEHIRILTKISRLTINVETRTSLMSSTTANEIYQIISKLPDSQTNVLT
jgi:mannitol/fructose-specific phosphotransferase system IIA component (Ntr-type)